MNIYEQILAGLQTKFPGADTATLQRIASSKSAGVTDEGQVQAIVDAITFMDVMKNYGDRRADDASKTAVQTYETKHNIKDGKPVTPAQQTPPAPAAPPAPAPQTPPATPQATQSPTELAATIAAAIGNALKPITDRLDKMEGASAQAAFDAKVDAVAKSFGIPEFAYKGRVIDPKTDLNVYFTDLKQTMINQGYQFPAAPESGVSTEKPGQTLADWTTEGTKSITNPQNK